MVEVMITCPGGSFVGFFSLCSSENGEKGEKDEERREKAQEIFKPSG